MMNEKEYSKVVAQNLRNIMFERGTTQAQVAKDLGINKGTLSSWMNATRTPKMTNIDMLCKYFNVPRSAIMEPSTHRKATQISDDTAGSGGRTRTQSACFLAESSSVPNYVPIPK